MTLIKELSVFLPCFNEEGNLLKTVSNVNENLQKVAQKWEILIIDDGSTDRTPDLADSLAKKDVRIKVIHHQPNQGYGGAVKSGLYGAKYQWVSFIDADGQFDFKEIKDFIRKQEETSADMVIGWYRKRRVPFLRKINTFVWQSLVFLLFRLRVKDIDCGFKLINKKVITSIPRLESSRGAFISSEFLIKARKAGFKIIEIPIHHYPRLKGQATGAKLNVIIQSFKDLFALWGKLRKS